MDQAEQAHAGVSVKISLAAAMSLRLVPGRFWRDASAGCLNLLLDYPGGCRANCAYCGLARERVSTDGDGSFIRVDWPSYPLAKVLSRLESYPGPFRRVCLSMVVEPHARRDTLAIIPILKRDANLPISLLASPAVLKRDDLATLRQAGVERFTVAFDAATEVLFDRHRGTQVRGPLDWSRYWQWMEWARPVFGFGNLGAHWIVGLGEREQDLVAAFLRVRRLGGNNHLFSFFPEPGSRLSQTNPPALRSYRRVQLARYLIDQDRVGDDAFEFDGRGRLRAFGLPADELDRVIESGRPFVTSGCPGRDGEVACNRPFGDSRPGPRLRNYPFELEPADVRRVRRQLGPMGEHPK